MMSVIESVAVIPKTASVFTTVSPRTPHPAARNVTRREPSTHYPAPASPDSHSR